METNPTRSYEEFSSPRNVGELAVMHSMLKPENRPQVEVQPSDGSEYQLIEAAV